MNHPTIMYRKEAVLGVGGYPPGVDFDLMLRLVQANCTLHNLASVLVHYRVYPESTTFHADVGTYVREVREKVAANSTGAAFINIYRKKIWGSACLSGDGSTDKAVEGLLEPLSILINGHDISRVLDVGCGISPWFERVLPDDLGVYLGVDVVPAVIQTRTTLRTHPKCEYRLLDMSQLAPSAKFDLAISRDVLTHLPDDLVLKVLANIKSCSRWLLTTQWPETDRNTNIQVGGWRAINLCLPPFNLPAPTATFQEVDKGKFLALFDLEGWKG
jgi:SAM-dependent methyltransferase